MDDDKIVQFRSITDASLETAVHMLDACGGDLGTAIECFLEQQQSTEKDDEKPTVSGGASASGGDNFLSEDKLVRAPIAAKASVLVEESFHRSYAPLRKAKQANSVFERFRDFEAETKSREASIFGVKSKKEGDVDNKRKTLETLFRPPLEIMHRGNLESAKHTAASDGMWLMVNVQKTDEFACQVLNRDVWNNGAVQELVRSNFILWQIFNDSAEGQRFETYYRVAGYPFVCILDPRTGEFLAALKTNDAVAFCDSVSAFLDRNPTFKSRDSNYAEHRRTAADSETVSTSTATIPKNPSQSSSGFRRGGKRRLMVNDDSSDMDVGNSGITNVDGFEEPKSKVVRMDDEDSSSGVSTSSAASIAKMSHPDNAGAELKQQNIEGSLVPFGTPDVRLMFRMPDGSKRYLGAPKRATIQEVLSYAEKEWHLSVSHHDFVMNYPTRRLNKENTKTTLEELGVKKQDVVYVEET